MMAITRKDFYIDTKEIQLLADAIARIPSHMPNVLEAALYQEATAIFEQSQKLVPVDTGALYSSGNVSQIMREGNRIFVRVGYGGPAAPYALYVHENLYAKHDAPTQAKYLETPLYRRVPVLIKNLATRINYMIRNQLPK
jgi:hypothetical protein